ncbi:MAG TPA: phosphodiester glycosidase family protein [Candidatus Cryosericum sp.]|nr:phosphodiester glycosidase family protein [Candidatus Cryosericum sp.]
MMKPPKSPAKRLITAIVVDLLILGALLYAYSYVTFLRVLDYTPKALSTPTPAAETATPAKTDALSSTPAGEAAESPSPTPVDTGLLGGKYAEKFTAGEVELTEDSYRSGNVCIEMSKQTAGTTEKPIVYYVADIYVKNISSFRTAVAEDYKDQNESDIKNAMPALQLSQLAGAIVSINGDSFAWHKSLAVRNGVEWTKDLPVYGDICVLYKDGTMETYAQNDVKSALIDEIYAKDPYHIWTFGPQLLIDGQVPANFTRSKANPLSAVGYFEPGHYCFILVDGRQKGYSWGMTLEELAQVFCDLGCKVAFNLDGGDTAVMTYNSAWRSQPEESSPRNTSDILFICEPDAP